MVKVCECLNCKDGCKADLLELQGSWIHVTGGEKGMAETICPSCGCKDPKPDLGMCESASIHRRL